MVEVTCGFAIASSIESRLARSRLKKLALHGNTQQISESLLPELDRSQLLHNSLPPLARQTTKSASVAIILGFALSSD